MLAYSHLNSVGKEITAQLFGGSIKLIAHHSGVTASTAQLRKEFRNTVVGTRSVKRMFQIITAEGGKHIFKQRISLTIGHSTLHEHADAVAHKATHIVDAMLR